MRTYSNVLSELTVILDDAVNLAGDNDTLEQRLAHVDVKQLIALSDMARPHGDVVLDNKLTALVLFADETGDRRRSILSTEKPEFQKGRFNTTHKDIQSSFCEKSACSFLFVLTNTKFIHCYFIISNEKNELRSVSFNETIYNIDDPIMIGSINILNDLERGLKTLTEYK